MFDLDEALAAWRRQMAAGGITSAEVLDELESHLRDDVKEQVRTGAGPEKAFDSAVRRIGPAAALREEFAKSGPPKGAWRFWQTFYYTSAAIAVLADLWAVIVFELSVPERAAGTCAAAGLASYLFSRPFLSWWSGGLARSRLWSAMKAMGILSPIWILFALLTALRLIPIEIGSVPAMIAWSLCAAWALTALECGLNDRYGGGGSGGWLPPFFSVPGPIAPVLPRLPGFGIPVPPASAFTPAAREAMDLAREEALRRGHDFIGTEHLLLGILRIAGDALARILEPSQVQGDAVRREIERLVPASPALAATGAPPLTPRARKALQLAGAEAAARQHPLIGPEHVFLGLLIEGSGVAALALNNLGVQLKRVRAQVFPTRAR